VAQAAGVYHEVWLEILPVERLKCPEDARDSEKAGEHDREHISRTTHVAPIS
jgi:hypothetical protein